MAKQHKVRNLDEPIDDEPRLPPKGRCDERLRHHGFAILARPKNGADVWMKGGKSYTTSEAHAECVRQERAG